MKGKMSSSLLQAAFFLLCYMMLYVENQILKCAIGKSSIQESLNCEGVTCCGSHAAQKWCTPTAITGESSHLNTDLSGKVFRVYCCALY